MLTAKSEDEDVVRGLELGADDYVTKPFDILELKARIRVILRRSGKVPGRNEEFVEIGNIKADLIQRTVYVGKEAVDLTAKEFDMLATLMRSQGKIFSREKLLSDVWGKDFPADIRTVDVHVRRLREKLEKDDANPEYILTKWGVGYYFKAE
jgi:DNA-binding response OmpR family regulator